MKSRIIFTLLVLILFSVSSPGQQQSQKPQEEDVVRITTNLVQVDAVVTDKNGKVVTDLKPEELEMFEDGHQQKITHFSYNSMAESAPEAPKAKPSPTDKNAPIVPPTRLKPEDIRRTIALVVDDLGLSFESTYYVRRALKKFVDEQMQPGDLVAIIRTSGGMSALQSFTADKRQLYAAIERVKFFGSGRSGISPFAPIEPPTPGEHGKEMDDWKAEQEEYREDLYSVGTLGAISYVVKGLKDLPGRKSILLISDGFRIYSQDDPTRDFRTLQRLQRLIDEAGRASVVIYTMNATGLQTLGATASDDMAGRNQQQLIDALSQRQNAAFETQEGMEYLAHETGGLAIKNNNDLSGGIRRVMEDQRGYYLIGYRPDQSTFNPRTGRRLFHHITLKVKRPGKFNVRVRNGFYGVSDEEKPKPKTLAQQLSDALMSPFGSTGVHLQLTSLFANDSKQGSIMRSLLYINSDDLTFIDEANNLHKCVFDVLAVTFGDNGVPIDRVGRTYTIELTDQQFKQMKSHGLVYYVTVPIKKPGAYQLRMSLRDSATERVGSASQFIDAPDLKKNRLALSGVVLNGGDRNERQTSDATNEGLEKGNADASAAVRHLRQGMVLNYGYLIYNAHFDKATNRPQLTTRVRLFRDGKEVFTGKEVPYDVRSQTDPKRLLAEGALQLGLDMPPGEYVLQVVVTDSLADQKHRTATQWMDFEILK